MMNGFGFDSHCHLDYLARKGKDLDQVIADAKAHGIEKFVSIATSMKSLDVLSQIAGAFDGVYISVGLHPCFVEEEGAVSSEQLLAEVQGREKVVALGETGLDYYRARTSEKEQKISFARHIEIARETSLPIVIHSRAANDDMLSLIEKEKSKAEFSAIWHCFEGSLDEAKHAVDLGLQISFSGLLTYKNKEEIRKVAKWLAWEDILIETDSPYLLPEPLAKTLNEPAHIIHTEAVLAEVREVDVQTLRQYLSTNFNKTFGLSETG